nr:energy-coupling factor transporter transmembrane component T [Shuttleworthia satelles]
MEEIVSYRPPRHRGLYFDPRTKVLVMFVLATLIFFTHENLLLNTIIVLIPITLLLSVGQYRPAFIYGALFVVALLSKLFDGRSTLPYLPAMLLGLIAELIFRFFPVFMFGYYIIKSTKPNEFISAMNCWHIPEAFIIPISVVFRFVPTLHEENEAIGNAMRMREIQFGTAKFRRNPTMILEYRVIPLMMSVAKIGDELSAAALSRGLGGLKKRSCLLEIHFGIWDLCLALLICLLIALTIIENVWPL